MIFSIENLMKKKEAAVTGKYEFEGRSLSILLSILEFAVYQSSDAGIKKIAICFSIPFFADVNYSSEIFMHEIKPVITDELRFENDMYPY